MAIYYIEKSMLRYGHYLKHLNKYLATHFTVIVTHTHYCLFGSSGLVHYVANQEYQVPDCLKRNVILRNSQKESVVYLNYANCIDIPTMFGGK